jgi:hypothetical protein
MQWVESFHQTGYNVHWHYDSGRWCVQRASNGFKLCSSSLITLWSVMLNRTDRIYCALRINWYLSVRLSCTPAGSALTHLVEFVDFMCFLSAEQFGKSIFYAIYRIRNNISSGKYDAILYYFLRVSTDNNSFKFLLIY